MWPFINNVNWSFQINKMNIETLPTSWYTFFKTQMAESYFASLRSFVEEEYEKEICYPPKKQILHAFRACPLEEIRVVILGQDPYHGPGQANGLSFSVNDGVNFPRSLTNIFKELENDLGIPTPNSGNLERWAVQGVLLLNAVLTVQQGKAGSHKRKGWEILTDAVIEHINTECENVVFMLWGGDAQKKGKKIDSEKHLILTSGHPSPLSANRGYWFGNKCFSQANAYLKSVGKSEIEW